MKRTQVQLDEATYAQVRREAFERGISMSALLRALLKEHLSPTPKPRHLEDFSFVGSGKSAQGNLAPISERHDEALAEDFTR